MRALVVLAVFALVAVGFTTTGGPNPTEGLAATIPSGFQDTVAIAGLDTPTNVEFSPDGRVFVAEKSGIVKVFDSLDDPTPTVFADLRTETFNAWDRGLLGLALDPGFPARPYVYVAYTYDAAIGATAPRWGTAGATADDCPTPPGPNADGCVVSGRVSRLTASGDVATTEKVLVEDWCQQYSSHSVGTIEFGPDGSLYAGGGDGASFGFADYGQDGHPATDVTKDNPCGDPPSPVGTALSPPSAQGGALRSQDLRTSGDPVGLDGTIIRIDPATGAGLPDNPHPNASDPNERRVVAYGLRNPFRFTVRPGTEELWVGDVGWKTTEEVNRIPVPRTGLDNFGWPCFEGTVHQSGYAAAGLSVCNGLYNQTPSPVSKPYLSYAHSSKVVSWDPCPTGSSSTSGLAFYDGGTYPDSYDGALFFADYARGCIWTALAGANGLPDRATTRTVVSGALPVELEVGPGGDVFWVDIAGSVHRLTYSATNRTPTARVTADPWVGASPLHVTLDASTSSDPDDDPLTYAWDLDDDGEYDDAYTPTVSRTYPNRGVTQVHVRVDDGHEGRSTASTPVAVDEGPPDATITSPASTLHWRVGDAIPFSGHATDPQQGTLPPSSLTWTLVLQHCPSTCHEHVVTRVVGVGSGTFVAPDHEYPSHLELRLTATDATGLSDTTSVRLDPRTVKVTVHSDPTGLSVALGDEAAATPYVRTVIAGSSQSVSAPTPQIWANSLNDFTSWSDGGAASHNIEADVDSTLTASYHSLPLGDFAPRSPARLLNTATGYHTTKRPLGNDGHRTVKVTGLGGIPTNATAVVLNLTARHATTDTAITAYPYGTPTPSAHTLPVHSTRATNTLTVVKIGTGGRILLHNTHGRTHLTADLLGYYAPRQASSYTPRSPARLLNTATGYHTTKRPLGNDGHRTVKVTGLGGIPTNATAVVLNLTARHATTDTAITAYPYGTPTPSAHTLPVHSTRATNTLTVVKIGTGGRILLHNTHGRTHLTADLLGYMR